MSGALLGCSDFGITFLGEHDRLNPENLGRRPCESASLEISTDGIQILEGLKSGEMIATTGVTQLREGMEVRDLGELEGYKP